MERTNAMKVESVINNREANKNARSKFRGVPYFKGKWHSRIGFDGKVYFLGRFDLEEEAAFAYNEVAIEYHGEFAKLNEVQGC